MEKPSEASIQKGKPLEASNNSSISLPTKAMLLALLVSKQTAVVMIGRYSRTGLSRYELCNITHLIIMTEAAKVFLNITLELFRGNGFKAFTKMSENTPNTLKLVIPALLYFAQNSLTYVALENLTAPIFQVLYQSKLLFTALLSTIVLKHHYTLQQWFCLIALCVGVAVVLMGEESHMSDKEQNLFLGLTCVFISGICSASAGVFFEMIIKEANCEVTLYIRNVQLAFFSLIIATIQRFRAESEPNSFFHGFNVWTWSLVILNATGGLVVSFVLKFLGNVMKGLMTGLTVFVSSFLSILIFHTNLNVEFVAGSALILGGTFYFHKHVQCRMQCATCLYWIFFLSSFLLFVANSISTIAFNFNANHHDHENTQKQRAIKKGCALVISSETRLKYKDGATIDSFEHVIRINKARTVGFEMYVGNKTTIRVCDLYKKKSGISPAQWFSDRNESGVKGITLNLTHEEKAGWHTEWNRLKLRTVSNWTMANRSLEDYCNQLIYTYVGHKDDFRCSSGAMTVLWALKHCENVTIFGLDRDQCSSYHHGIGLSTSVNCSNEPKHSGISHDFFLEERYIKNLHRKGNLTVNRFVE